MDQNFLLVNRSRLTVARRVVRLLVRAARCMMRMLLRRPVIDILFVIFILYLLATLIGGVNQPHRQLLNPTPPTVFEGR